MNTFAEVIDSLGGYARLAAVIGVSAGTVSSMRSRNSIPAAYWRRIVNEAARQGIDGISFETLALIAERETRPEQSHTSNNAAA